MFQKTGRHVSPCLFLPIFPSHSPDATRHHLYAPSYHEIYRPLHFSSLRASAMGRAWKGKESKRSNERKIKRNKDWSVRARENKIVKRRHSVVMLSSEGAATLFICALSFWVTRPEYYCLFANYFLSSWHCCQFICIKNVWTSHECEYMIKLHIWIVKGRIKFRRFCEHKIIWLLSPSRE